MSERENTPLPAIAGREVDGPAHPVDGGPVEMGDPSGMDLDGMFDAINSGIAAGIASNEAVSE